MTSTGRGIVEVHFKCSQWAIKGEFFICVCSICLPVCLPQVFSNRHHIGRSRHQTAAMCVCWNACVCRCLWVCIACQSIDLKFLLWSLAFVCLIYLFCRPSFHCHSLTHSSDRFWVLHRWENNTHLWPLELFLLQKPQRKNALAAHDSLNVYQGTRGAERHFKTGIDLQLVSGAGIEQNRLRFTACTLHVLCMDCREPKLIQCCQQFSVWFFLWAVFSVK